MKDSQAVIVIAVIILLGILAFVIFKKEPVVENPNPPVVQQESIIGCYVAGADKDVYTLNIQAQQDEKVTGKLAFKNFQKDSSSGTFSGTYQDGILLGDYSFTSEGMDSVMQVIFQKVGDDFVRGYGPVDSASGTQFTNFEEITYDISSELSMFEKSECVE